MPIFEYTALNSTGKQSKGTIDADSVRSARQKLRSQGIFPTEVKEGKEVLPKSKDVKRFFNSDRVSSKNLAVATRQLATLVGAGIPLVEALHVLSEQTENIVLKRLVIDVREKVEEGSSLAKAMAGFPKAFPRLYVNMVTSGEASGTLDTVLENLADYLESANELKRKITSALFYPALMILFCITIVIALLAYVVPTIVEIFQKQGATLPLPTKVLIAISDLLRGYWYVMIGLIFLGIYLFRWYYRQPAGRAKIDSLRFKIPLYGNLYTKICTARVSRTLGTLLTSGVGLLTALDIIKNIIPNVHVTKAIEDARDGVREGRGLARELSKSGIFPSMLSHMISIGERSGRMEPMLVRSATAFENEVTASISGLTSLIEPIMIILLGGIVLAIVAAVLMPMVSLTQIMQQ